MSGRRYGRAWTVAVAVVCAGAVLSACDGGGDLEVANDSGEDVTVLTGDEESDVDGGGGVVLLDHGCTPGDVTVVRASGAEEVVDGPVCPDEKIVVRDDEAVLVPVGADDDS
ncbi:hypothetical protein [Cellulosimicrobium cellulans]|uniref:hypothetical protein n=1 Tax=Cellulosimicrobium cellulans TaxID=1710 RepID=UPI0024055541|nr:hypothetical protein [Cellulosimicrobium cellulans]MDF9876251.1 hypothetical protein [Cellulosimicrobium cellulans]